MLKKAPSAGDLAELSDEELATLLERLAADVRALGLRSTQRERDIDTGRWSLLHPSTWAARPTGLFRSANHALALGLRPIYREPDIDTPPSNARALAAGPKTGEP